MPADGQTDRTKLIVTFRNSVNAPTKHALTFACNYKTQHEDAFGIGGIAPRILNIGSTGNWSALMYPPFYPCYKTPHNHPLTNWGVPQCPSVRHKNNFFLSALKRMKIFPFVAWSLYWLSYRGFSLWPFLSFLKKFLPVLNCIKFFSFVTWSLYWLS